MFLWPNDHPWYTKLIYLLCSLLNYVAHCNDTNMRNFCHIKSFPFRWSQGAYFRNALLRRLIYPAQGTLAKIFCFHFSHDTQWVSSWYHRGENEIRGEAFQKQNSCKNRHSTFQAFRKRMGLNKVCCKSLWNFIWCFMLMKEMSLWHKSSQGKFRHAPF